MAITPSVFEIIKSNAVAYYAPVGETIPDETTIALGTAWGGNWDRLGLTSAPLTCAIEMEFSDVDVEEYLMKVRKFPTSEAVSFETMLAQLNADVLALLLKGTVSTTAAGPSQVGFEEVDLGNLDGEYALDEYAFGIEGAYRDSNGDEFPVRLFIYRANMSLNGELTFTKREDDIAAVPLMVEAMADPTNSGQWGKFQRVTAAATS